MSPKTMIPSRNSRIIAWVATVFIVGVIGALVVFLPIVAAVAFVLLVTLLSVAVSRNEGRVKGMIYFLKEILFGW